MNIEQKITELNIELPKLGNKDLPFASAVIVDNLVYLSGQTPMVEGEVRYKGTVGATVTTEEAQEAAEICCLNLLAALKNKIGDLNKVKRVIKVAGYVASETNYMDQPKVINSASNLINKIFGEENKHARVAIGVAALPGGAAVEIEMIVEINN